MTRQEAEKRAKELFNDTYTPHDTVTFKYKDLASLRVDAYLQAYDDFIANHKCKTLSELQQEVDDLLFEQAKKRGW